MQNITPIVESVIALMVVIITTVLFPWIRKNVDYSKLKLIIEYSSIFVSAAEQIFKGPGRGSEKKEYVESALRDKLNSLGIAVDFTTLDSCIEDAVRQLDEEFKEVVLTEE